MKRLFLFVLSSLSIAVLASCQKEEEPFVPALEVSASEIAISDEGGAQSLSISSNTSWTIVGGKAWLSVTPSTGDGDKVIVLSASENSSLNSRECTLQVTTDDGSISRSINVIQSKTAEILNVSVENLIISSSAGSSATFNINSNDTWKIIGCPDWVELSTLNGTGDVTIVAKSLTTNYSAADRSATVVISSSSKSIELMISQKAAWMSNCVAKPVNVTVLYDSAAFEWELSENVAYYYYGSIDKTAADRMTTMEIVETIIEGDDRCTPGDNYISSVNYLDPTTEYVLYTVAFDKDGVQGDLYKYNFTTKSYSNQPYALISDVEFSSTNWYWSTNIGPYASAYYMWATESYEYYYLANSLVAYLMKENLDNYPDSFPRILQSGDWVLERDEDQIQIITWGVSGNGELGGYIERFQGEIEAYDVNKKTSISYDEFNDLKSELKRIY